MALSTATPAMATHRLGASDPTQPPSGDARAPARSNALERDRQNVACGRGRPRPTRLPPDALARIGQGSTASRTRSCASSLGEIGVDRASATASISRPRSAALVSSLLVVGIGDEAHLQQHRRHVGGQQHDAGRRRGGCGAAAVVSLADPFAAGSRRRRPSGCAVARCVRSSRIWLTARSRPGRLAFISQSSLREHRAPSALGALFRQGVDAGAAGRRVGPRIGVQRDEQVGVGAAGDLHARCPAAR